MRADHNVPVIRLRLDGELAVAGWFTEVES